MTLAIAMGQYAQSYSPRKHELPHIQYTCTKAAKITMTTFVTLYKGADQIYVA